MAEHEIDKEDVHDRSKWRRNVNVMKRNLPNINYNIPLSSTLKGVNFEITKPFLVGE